MIAHGNGWTWICSRLERCQWRGRLGEIGRHGREMMDGSHASHCEKIIARCRQLRQCGGKPKPRENKRPRIPCVWVSAGLPARGAPNLHIYMWRSRVNCSEFLRWVQSGGRCCFILHNKHTVSTLFPRNLKQKCKKVLRENSSSQENKFDVMRLREKYKQSYHKDNYGESMLRTNGSSRLILANISVIYSVLSQSVRLINCIGGSLKKTWRFRTFPRLACVFGKRFVFDSASQENVHVCRRAKRPL